MPRDYKLQLDDILEAIGRIREYTDNMSEESFGLDHKTQDAVIRNLEIIGEAARNLPDEIKNSASEIQWHKIIALRNLLIHEYFGVNTKILWDVITNKLGGLEEACRKLY
ncbi:MAG: DUF86 domain-containing protein [Planctomycetes bacterium]|nr:DUF86 domain-containing protein [Planctomycetota bacterium]